MDANEAIKLLEESELSIKEMFKLYRILDIRITLILASGVGKDMHEKEPELFAPPEVRTHTDENGYAGDIVLPWEDGYAGLKASRQKGETCTTSSDYDNYTDASGTGAGF